MIGTVEIDSPICLTEESRWCEKCGLASVSATFCQFVPYPFLEFPRLFLDGRKQLRCADRVFLHNLNSCVRIRSQETFQFIVVNRRRSPTVFNAEFVMAKFPKPNLQYVFMSTSLAPKLISVSSRLCCLRLSMKS